MEADEQQEDEELEEYLGWRYTELDRRSNTQYNHSWYCLGPNYGWFFTLAVAAVLRGEILFYSKKYQNKNIH